MKQYTTILEEIKNNQQRAAALEAQADELLKKPERAAANSITKKIALHKSIIEEAEATAINLYAEAEQIKNNNTILAENVKASFAAYVTPIIKEIMQQYNGKQYGPKTREKIREAAKTHNIAFYFDGYSELYRVHVYSLSDEGDKDYNGPEIELHATDAAGHTTAFISENNKILDVNNIIFSSHYTYTESPDAKRAELEAAYCNYKKLVEQAAEAEKKLNALLPDNVKHFDVIGYLSPWQKPY